MDNLLTIDGKKYDPNTLPPSAIHAIQLFARAQNDHTQKALDLEIATTALTALSAQMRGALMGVPEYVPPMPAPTTETAPEPDAETE